VISRADMAARGVPPTTVNGWYRDRARTGHPEKAGRIGRPDYWYEDEWTAWYQARQQAKTGSLTQVDRAGPMTCAGSGSASSPRVSVAGACAGCWCLLILSGYLGQVPQHGGVAIQRGPALAGEGDGGRCAVAAGRFRTHVSGVTQFA